MKQIIHTHYAPKPVGSYSQAIKTGNTVYISAQLPLDVDSMELVSADLQQQVRQVFNHLDRIAQAAGGSLAQFVKLTIYLNDLKNVSLVNAVTAEYFAIPYPVCVMIEVQRLLAGAQVSIDGILVLGE